MTQIISYRQIENVEWFHPQNGMYFKPKNNDYLIVLMSVWDDAPYQDEISEDGKRIVHKFELKLTENKVEDFQDENKELPDDNRIIPSHVQIEVYKRDKGHCVKCVSKNHLHLDRIYSFAKNGTTKY